MGGFWSFCCTLYWISRDSSHKSFLFVLRYLFFMYIAGYLGEIAACMGIVCLKAVKY